MGIFGADVDYTKVDAPQGGNYYFLAGSYEVEICVCKVITTQKTKERMFILETKVLESSVEGRPAGSRPNWTQKGSGKAALVAPQNMKMLWSAAAGLNIFDPKDSKVIAAFDWNSFEASAVSEDNPLKGCRLHVEAVDTKSAEGKPFTKVTFTPPKDPSDFQKSMTKTAREAIV